MCRRDPRASPDCQKGPCYKEVLRTVLGFCHPHGQSQAAALFSLDQVGREKRAWRELYYDLKGKARMWHTSPFVYIPLQRTQSHGHTQTQWRLGNTLFLRCWGGKGFPQLSLGHWLV